MSDKGSGEGGGGRRGAGERAYRGAVTGLSLVFLTIGLLSLVLTLAHGGGPASIGFLLGIAFLGVGGGRLWVNSRMGR